MEQLAANPIDRETVEAIVKLRFSEPGSHQDIFSPSDDRTADLVRLVRNFYPGLICVIKEGGALITIYRTSPEKR